MNSIQDCDRITSDFRADFGDVQPMVTVQQADGEEPAGEGGSHNAFNEGVVKGFKYFFHKHQIF